MRRTLDETWAILEAREEDVPRGEDGTPLVPAQKPSADDDELGFSFFRTEVTGDYSSLTLPRTFFGRSDIADATFKNSDLTESVLCWNDFNDVDFSDALLVRADLRASGFAGCSFAGANLRGADMRGSGFVTSTFAGTSMEGAQVEKTAAWLDGLSQTQRAGLVLTDGAGEAPDGG